MELVKVHHSQENNISPSADGIKQSPSNLGVPSAKETMEQNPFIEANTTQVTMEHLKKDCIVPVFKDNEVAISHTEFVETAINAVSAILGNVEITKPQLRVSHMVKGRTPDALHIPTKDLQDHQKTIYYERVAWVSKIPSQTKIINGNEISLCVGGVKSYSTDNLHGKHSVQRFKMFIGYVNRICTNLCISTDGYKDEIKVMSTNELGEKVEQLVSNYDADYHLNTMERLSQFTLSEKQFGQLIGKAKLYNYLPKSEKQELPNLMLTDNQFSSIARDYYNDVNFCRNKDGSIDLWRLYNLCTGAAKSSYIDTFLNRNLNAFQFVNGLADTVNGDSNSYDWFLS
ncbi:DUF3871 family protein [Gaetbulibacter sp. NE]|uniref:DUF3871 family protein n=1 Tax=Gaetbulibacter sp. NE TaxID=2982307 RepID=UPI0021D1C8E7|nr:DUF3871 family protein [Gaetbulibacter sp. NE]